MSFPQVLQKLHSGGFLQVILRVSSFILRLQGCYHDLNVNEIKDVKLLLSLSDTPTRGLNNLTKQA